MKIGVDISQVAFEGTGVARYTANLVKAVCEFDTQNEYTFFFSSLRRPVPQEIKDRIQPKHRLVTAKFPPTLLDFLWNTLHVLPLETFIGAQDIFISSDWTQPPSNAKKVTIVHDLVYLRFPETVHKTIAEVQKRRLQWVKKEADLIIADSEATKQDLIELLSIHKDKIRVVYPAVEIDVSVTANYKPPTANQYILSVGKLEPRKNIPRLIEAFQKADLKDIDLLIVGPKGWDEAVTSDKLQVKSSKVKFLGFVPDSDLYTLYKNALFFIYPSLYEGFGYPVIEAMSLGCPVGTSNTSSLKEIAENNALLFNPEDTGEITDAIKKLAEDRKLRQQLSQKGHYKAIQFSLLNFTRNILRVL